MQVLEKRQASKQLITRPRWTNCRERLR